MTTTFCLLCGAELPRRRWWQSPWFLGGPPMCDRKDPEVTRACYNGLARRIGIDVDSPDWNPEPPR